MQHAIAVQIVKGQEQLREPPANPLFRKKDAPRLLDPLRHVASFAVTRDDAHGGPLVDPSVLVLDDVGVAEARHQRHLLVSGPLELVVLLGQADLLHHVPLPLGPVDDEVGGAVGAPADLLHDLVLLHGIPPRQAGTQLRILQVSSSLPSFSLYLLGGVFAFACSSCRLSLQGINAAPGAHGARDDGNCSS